MLVVYIIRLISTKEFISLFVYTLQIFWQFKKNSVEQKIFKLRKCDYS
jgi:hypothetical protein